MNLYIWIENEELLNAIEKKGELINRLLKDYFKEQKNKL